MLRNLSSVPLRVIVTGSRGKSSLTRLLHAGLNACGLRTHARITGVIPRELTPKGERVIRRRSPADIREMRWWLSQVPPDADALVVENSAVSPELQSFAPDLVSPTLAVWTTLRADHVEVWGPGREGAAKTLIRGVPRGVPVAAGMELTLSPLPELFKANGNILYTPAPGKNVFLPGALSGSTHDAENLALAQLACELCRACTGLDIDVARAARAMSALAPDIADFRIVRNGTDELAAAFSANDTESTTRLFEETGWSPEETTLLYHHRPDRNARLASFLPWIESYSWRKKIYTRSRRTFPSCWSAVEWNDAVESPSAFKEWWKGRGRVFACGNVAGWPIEFLMNSTIYSGF